MFKTLFALAAFAIIGLPILLVLGAVIGGSTGSSIPTPPKVKPVSEHAPPHSSAVKPLLSALAFAAAVVALVLGANFGAGWAVLPAAIWFLIFITIRDGAETSGIQDKQAERPARRMESFGTDGYALLRRAEDAIDQVMTSKAVTEGWLGPHNEIDFQSDIDVIKDRLRRRLGIRQVLNELSRLPDPSDTDRHRKEEATRAEAKMLEDVHNRVKRLETLAREVQTTDRELRLRLLTDIDDNSQANLSGTVESTRAMLTAYREVKGLDSLDHKTSTSSNKNGEVQKTPSKSNEGFFNMVKQWWYE